MKSLIWIFLFTGSASFAQSGNDTVGRNPYAENYVSMPAGKQYKASHWKKIWWGKHWRKEWVTTVNFPVFDLSAVAGGLSPIKMGGGHQTKSIRLIGGDGKEYVLRSIDKTLDLLIPDAFSRSFINDIINDQISTAHPYGPLVIANLEARLGILHTNPKFVYLTDDEHLKEFRNEFSNKLYLFEERPSGDGWDHTALLGLGSKVVNTEKLLEKLRLDNSIQVDQHEFLKVRLFDMLVNDWDRHDDQWVWVKVNQNGKTAYRPFARDRDQAFSKTDGVNLYFLSRPWALRSLQNMDPKVKDVIGINLAATSLDRQFLNGLSKQDWIDTIKSLQALLSDSAIEKAMQVMPDKIYELSGTWLQKRVMQRRNDLTRFGMRYYRTLSKEVTIVGTDEREIFTIHTIDKKSTEITIKAINEKYPAGKLFYHRVFYRKETKNIHLYGLGDKDLFIFTGNARSRIQTRIISRENNDHFQDSTTKAGAGKKTMIYSEKGFESSLPSKLFRFRHTSDTALLHYNRAGFKYDWWMPLFFPGYNPDDGVVIGAGITFKKMRWDKQPFYWQQTIVAKYAAATRAFDLHYYGLFKNSFGKWDLDLTGDYKAPSFVVNFYGYGNDTKLATENKSFYRVKARSILIAPGISRSWKQHSLKTDIFFNSVKVESDNNKFISKPASGIDTLVFNRKYYGGITLAYTYSTVNNIKYPTRGINVNAVSRYVLNLKEAQQDYIQLIGSLSFFYTPFKNITLAHRTGGATNRGEFEFYQAHTVGGGENLRGYWRSRFTGQSSFYQNTDLRWKAIDLKGYVFRGALGLYGFFDDGRVWIKEEHSRTLHIGYGGGVYYIPYGTLLINLYYASSRETSIITLSTGFLF